MRVLVVEDDFLVAFEVDDALNDAGHQVEVAPNTSQALDIVSRTGADLAVVDVHLTEGSNAGVGLARTLYEQFGVRTLFVDGAAPRARRRPQLAGAANEIAGVWDMPLATCDLRAALGIAEQIIRGLPPRRADLRQTA